MHFSQEQQPALCHSIGESAPPTSTAPDQLSMERVRECYLREEDHFFHGFLARGSLRVAGDRTRVPLVWCEEERADQAVREKFRRKGGRQPWAERGQGTGRRAGPPPLVGAGPPAYVKRTTHWVSVWISNGPPKGPLTCTDNAREVGRSKRPTHGRRHRRSHRPPERPGHRRSHRPANGPRPGMTRGWNTLSRTNGQAARVKPPLPHSPREEGALCFQGAPPQPLASRETKPSYPARYAPQRPARRTLRSHQRQMTAVLLQGPTCGTATAGP
jgi:hypothetical protein